MGIRTFAERQAEFFYGGGAEALAYTDQQAEMVGNILAEQAVGLEYGVLVLLVEGRKHERAIEHLRNEQSQKSS